MVGFIDESEKIITTKTNPGLKPEQSEKLQ